jgi:hypothetical protein
MTTITYNLPSREKDSGVDYPYSGGRRKYFGI